MGLELVLIDSIGNQLIVREPVRDRFRSSLWILFVRKNLFSISNFVEDSVLGGFFKFKISRFVVSKHERWVEDIWFETVSVVNFIYYIFFSWLQFLHRETLARKKLRENCLTGKRYDSWTRIRVMDGRGWAQGREIYRPNSLSFSL